MEPAASFVAPEPVDVIWTSQNYHDMHVERFGIPDYAGVNKAFYNALKPGGVYIVLDHAASAGSGLADTEKLHRIDPAVVKAEVIAAGFVFEGESTRAAQSRGSRTRGWCSTPACAARPTSSSTSSASRS